MTAAERRKKIKEFVEFWKPRSKTKLNFINNLLLGLDAIIYLLYFSLVTIAAYAASTVLENYSVVDTSLKLAKMDIREAIIVTIIYVTLTTLNYIFKDKKAAQYTILAISCGILVGYIVSIIRLFAN